MGPVDAAETLTEIISSTMTKVERRIGEPLSEDWRREQIAVAAYYLAEHRGFECGHDVEDWLAAEAEVNHAGITVS
jgi:hypothetical protein